MILIWFPGFERKFFQSCFKSQVPFEYFTQDQKHSGHYLSCRVLKWRKFCLLIQRHLEKGFCPGNYYDGMEQTNHVRPYLTLCWFRHCLSHSWCNARWNILLHVRATMSLYLFTVRSDASRKSRSGYQDCWNYHLTNFPLVSYIFASKGLHSREKLLALPREM